METSRYNNARPHPAVVAGAAATGVEAEGAASTTGTGRDGGAARSLITTRDGLELPLYRWPASGPRRATVALIHGLAEHAGRYAPLAERLNAVGIELLAIDLRGHGNAPGKRVRVERFDDYLLDAEALLSIAADDGAPLFLMGHSMGGAIAALYAIERLPSSGHRLAGLILSSPALAPGRDVPRWMLTMSQIISRIWPGFPAMKIDAALLSRNPAIVEANRNDPLVHHGSVPARTGAEILLAMARIERGRAGLRVPLLVYHGTADKLTEPDGSRAFGQHAGSPDKTLTMHEASYHETINDLDRERVIGELIAWIQARCG
ncbi:alpha/beta hydrolase [Paraburkholderia phenazinium]|uniref:Lysophospholipase, alpha-beta hydrolase superfamily n=1 Tax=Paraburkholderia phenazinium TaxID=60549 RepID=A0A1G7VX14_9BURK|nr:alpha/beta hydrolase [Paraburkholderia phenazinium]SDG64312.1 Lysophospholipase, alpha-beta hydrolase superfamily [Paraburkholderia phenazinium]